MHMQGQVKAELLNCLRDEQKHGTLKKVAQKARGPFGLYLVMLMLAGANGAIASSRS